MSRIQEHSAGEAPSMESEIKISGTPRRKDATVKSERRAMNESTMCASFLDSGGHLRPLSGLPAVRRRNRNCMKRQTQDNDVAKCPLDFRFELVLMLVVQRPMQRRLQATTDAHGNV